mgnify:CR=1 FL=1
MFLKLPPTDNSLLPIYLYFDHEKAPEKKARQIYGVVSAAVATIVNKSDKRYGLFYFSNVCGFFFKRAFESF